jgi:hypothetical protein
MVEHLSVNEQQRIIEFIKGISINNSDDTNELNLELIHLKQIETINSVIENLNNAEPLLDDELDDILTQGISFRSPEELDLL